VTWQEEVQQTPEMGRAVCDRQRARVPAVVDKIEQELRASLGKWPLFDIQGAQDS